MYSEDRRKIRPWYFESLALALALGPKSLALALALWLKSLALALALESKSLALALALRVVLGLGLGGLA